MWYYPGNRDDLYAKLEQMRKEQFGEYVSGKEQWTDGQGWCWIETRSIYFSGNCRDRVTMAVPASVRIEELKEKIKELVDELVRARRTIRG